ncbi:alcohol-forming fatty acyl-CoA reductase [Ranunculus cassubicifolius]
MGKSLNGMTGLDIKHVKWLVKQTLEVLQANKVSKEEEAQTMKVLGMKRAKHYGWPNTYVFTKAIGEMLLGHMRDNLPLVVVRPTVITSTYREPFPGWIEGSR